LSWLREEGEYDDEELRKLETAIDRLERNLPSAIPRWPGPLATATADGNLAIEWGIKGSRCVAILEGSEWRVAYLLVDGTSKGKRGISANAVVEEFITFVRAALVVAT